MAVTAFAGHMDERAIVFDCMDQLSQFRGAPKELLSPRARIAERRGRCFLPVVRRSAVIKSSTTRTRIPMVAASTSNILAPPDPRTRQFRRDVARLDGPVFGFFGVVDERMDYDLVAALADANPGGHVVIIGPMTKIDPSSVPLRSNLHWLGARDYSLLPAYVKRFDVCLMPFADQRGYRVHQSDQGAGIHGDRQAHREHARRGCGVAV